MMKYYVVDAFADKVFSGNPAGICLLTEELADSVMQSIAFENNLAETAFLLKKEGYYDLRWFTPEVEIDLCGHATLASAYLLMNFIDTSLKEVEFHTKSGVLTVKKKDDNLLLMDFPSRKPIPTEVPKGIEKALGIKVLEAHLSRDLVLVVESEKVVEGMEVDANLLKEYKDVFGVIVTAKGESCDFVSRYFAPNAGIMEDPVTGSAHSTLIPFWSERLHKKEMMAKQLSKRGGVLYCLDCNDRVKIGGTAVLYLCGELMIDN